MANVKDLKFSVVDVTKIVTVIVCFCVQYYSLKDEIKDAISSQKVDKKEFGLQIAINTKAIEGLNNKYDFLIRNEVSPADKPKPIQIESE